ncbi:MAG TPA: response regulator transcription factor [Syntrophorhabdaceae bacterium]|nr:response regulator transcription factor [Syntrophorhabdaceae bacterium]HQM80574.1 response regulator transcription factor [Syntrophorhabdaceae bacterium]
MTIRLILADDHKIVREGLRAIFEKITDVEVIAEAEDGLETVRLAKKLLPDIVIMDIGMPNMNGIDATRQIIAETKGVRVLALSTHTDSKFVMQMLGAGASGYLPKDCTCEELVAALHAAITNQLYLSPRITDVVIREYLHNLPKREPSVFTILTTREREVLQMMAEGKTTKEIASRLNVSVKTVDTHRQQIMAKLNIHSIAELTKYAIREGITSLEP